MKRPGFLSGRTPRSEAGPERRFFRFAFWSIVAMFVILSLSALGAFLLTLRGYEETLVPDIAGETVVDALVLLQERGLYPRVQLRYFSDPDLKHTVVSQDPEPGALVRVGRRITMVVSQGSIIDSVADFRGRPLTEVQAELQALGPQSGRSLVIDAVSYVYDDAPVGTIIEQNPQPGTQVTGQTDLDLVVSRGEDVERFSLPSFIGLEWRDAIQVLSRDDVPFVFELEPQPSAGPEGVVVEQSPEPASQVVVGTPVELTIRNQREVPEGFGFGMFDRTLPEYAVSVELSAVALGPEGEPTTLFQLSHPGGRIAFPYLLEYGSQIVVYRYDTEVIRYIVREENDPE
jgi:beta-lactam-binding protein with PASTA domain